MIQTHHLIWWLIIGFIAGAIAGRVVSGKGYGCIANTAVGLAGAFIGGFIFDHLSPRVVLVNDFVDQLIVAFIGAVILLVVLRLLSPRRRVL